MMMTSLVLGGGGPPCISMALFFLIFNFTGDPQSPAYEACLSQFQAVN